MASSNEAQPLLFSRFRSNSNDGNASTGLTHIADNNGNNGSHKLVHITSISSDTYQWHQYQEITTNVKKADGAATDENQQPFCKYQKEFKTKTFSNASMVCMSRILCVCLFYFILFCACYINTYIASNVFILRVGWVGGEKYISLQFYSNDT